MAKATWRIRGSAKAQISRSRRMTWQPHLAQIESTQWQVFQGCLAATCSVNLANNCPMSLTSLRRTDDCRPNRKRRVQFDLHLQRRSPLSSRKRTLDENK